MPQGLARALRATRSMRIKDIIALGILALVSFPVVLLGVLMWTGNVRLVFGPDDPSASTTRERLQVRAEDLPELAESHVVETHVAGDGAVMLREAELDNREAQVQRDLARLEELRLEDARLRDTIVAERKRIDLLLSGKDSLEQSRLGILARTFTGMKPDQAAKILVGLDDIIVTGVLRAVKDDKPRAKLLAAVGKLDSERAAAIARLLRAVDQGRPADGKPAEPKPAAPVARAAADSSTPSKEVKP